MAELSRLTQQNFNKMTFPPVIDVENWYTSNISFLSLRVIVHFHDSGRGYLHTLFLFHARMYRYNRNPGLLSEYGIAPSPLEN